MASVVLLTAALMPPRGTVATKTSKQRKPKAVASVELLLPDDTKASEVFLRIAAEFKHIAEALDTGAPAPIRIAEEVPQ